MEGVRNRKSNGHDGEFDFRTFPSERSANSRNKFKQFSYFVIIIFTIFFLTVIFHNHGPFKNTRHRSNILDHISANLGYHKIVHAVVIDAGSTGSRVLAFTFLRNVFDNSLKLVDELFHEVKPGLSSYVGDPKKGAESLIPLINVAKTKISKDFWNSTPLVLKATAGLRLLRLEDAEKLLIEVKKVIDSSEFFVSENSIGIMDGKDEGIFSWFTVNYLSDLIVGDPKDTLIALDLGGGSAQITFLPTDDVSFSKISNVDLSSIWLFQKEYQLFTKSYLGLGLMAARSLVLESDKVEGEKIVHSPCFNPIVNTIWSYHGKTYHIRGPTEVKYRHLHDGYRSDVDLPIADYDMCYEKCSNVIANKVVDKMPEMENREVIAFSYFFDRAMETGLIDPFKGGTISVESFGRAAKSECETPNADRPFACLDLTFITAFLQRGYGFSSSKNLKLYKKIEGSETSWALGLAFHVINNGI